MYFLNTLLKVVSHDDLRVLSMSVMGLQITQSFVRGVGIFILGLFLTLQIPLHDM